MISVEFSLNRKLEWEPEAESPSGRRSILVATLTVGWQGNQGWRCRSLFSQTLNLCHVPDNEGKVTDYLQIIPSSGKQTLCVLSQAPTGLGAKPDAQACGWQAWTLGAAVSSCIWHGVLPLTQGHVHRESARQPCREPCGSHREHHSKNTYRTTDQSRSSVFKKENDLLT